MPLIRPLSADETPRQDETLVRARLVTDGREFRLAVHLSLHVWEISHYLAKQLRHMGWDRIIHTHANLPLTIGEVNVSGMVMVERIVHRLKGMGHVMYIHILQQDTPCLFKKTKRAIRKEAKRALRFLSSDDTRRLVHAIHFINSVLSPMSAPEPVLSEGITELMEAADHVEAAYTLQALSHALYGIVNPSSASAPTRIKHAMDEDQCR